MKQRYEETPSTSKQRMTHTQTYRHRHRHGCSVVWCSTVRRGAVHTPRRATPSTKMVKTRGTHTSTMHPGRYSSPSYIPPPCANLHVRPYNPPRVHIRLVIIRLRSGTHNSKHQQSSWCLLFGDHGVHERKKRDIKIPFKKYFFREGGELFFGCCAELSPIYI